MVLTGIPELCLLLPKILLNALYHDSSYLAFGQRNGWGIASLPEFISPVSSEFLEAFFQSGSALLLTFLLFTHYSPEVIFTAPRSEKDKKSTRFASFQI